MNQMIGSHRNFDWFLTATLASITALVFCIALGFNILTLFLGDDFLQEPTESEAILPFAFMGMFAVFSLFWFWIRMLTDYFRIRPERHAVAWGWALVMLNFGASLAYFWFIWRPRHARQRE